MADPVSELQAWAQPHLFYGGLAVIAIGFLLAFRVLSAGIAALLLVAFGVGIVVDVVAHDIQH